jgi:hypothetical protein
MYNSKLQEKLYLLDKAEDFAQIYTNKIKENIKKDPEAPTLILIRDFTPIFILGFASYFDNVRIILTQNYDFKNDVMFNMNNTNKANVLSSYIKALYFKAPALKTLIRQGYKLRSEDLNYNPANYNMNRISVKLYTINFDMDQYLTTLKGFPALVIDARIFENTIKEVKKNESNLVQFYTNLMINRVVKFEEEELKEGEIDLDKLEFKIRRDTDYDKVLKINETVVKKKRSKYDPATKIINKINEKKVLDKERTKSSQRKKTEDNSE